MTFQKGNTLGSVNKNRKFSEKWRANLSAAHIGQQLSPTTKAKISAKMKGKYTHLYKDGRSAVPGYRSWQKNLRLKRKRKNGGSHTWEEWEALKLLYRLTCPACLLTEPDICLTEDHIYPISKGGTDDITNIQPFCKSCNLKKHTKIIKYPLRSEDAHNVEL